MSKIDDLCADLRAETDKIWLDEPDEIRAMRLGIFESDAGSYGQYFSNLVFVNGDMRALSTWITPAIVLRAASDDRFTLDQCKDVFAWTNLVNVDFLAYCGFVKFGEFIHRIVDAFDEISSKEEFDRVLAEWYAYANRMYLWVHHSFPWGLGTAYPKPSAEDLEFMQEARTSKSVAGYFDKYGTGLVSFADTEGE
ncbi:MAG: hypothetical protein JST08_07305 [Actinobacteria bacterium]|nr:hypothetical protein [Actinomycetota bacterium]